jgi:hypothetical protein
VGGGAVPPTRGDNQGKTKVSRFLYCISLINNINKPIKSDKLLYFTITYGKLPDLVLPPVVIFNNRFSIPNPWWLVGFICGEGSFTYYSKKYISNKSNLQLERFHHTLSLEISQDSKNLHVLKAIVSYFSVGNIFSEKRGISKYKLSVLELIQHICLPFFHPANIHY